jgi:hypothetical protein
MVPTYAVPACSSIATPAGPSPTTTVDVGDTDGVYAAPGTVGSSDGRRNQEINVMTTRTATTHRTGLCVIRRAGAAACAIAGCRASSTQVVPSQRNPSTVAPSTGTHWPPSQR